MQQKRNPLGSGQGKSYAHNSTTATTPPTEPPAPSRLHHFSPADLLLPRLEKVQERGPGSWVACCPAHEDKSPSLSIRETADGTLLIKCFSGCSIEAITTAAGLLVRNLFPHDDRDDYGPRRKVKAPPFPWRDAIRTLKEDLSAISIGAALCAGEDLPEEDCMRLALAASRIRDLLEVVE